MAANHKLPARSVRATWHSKELRAYKLVAAVGSYRGDILSRRSTTNPTQWDWLGGDIWRAEPQNPTHVKETSFTASWGDVRSREETSFQLVEDILQPTCRRHSTKLTQSYRGRGEQHRRPCRDWCSILCCEINCVCVNNFFWKEYKPLSFISNFIVLCPRRIFQKCRSLRPFISNFCVVCVCRHLVEGETIHLHAGDSTNGVSEKKDREEVAGGGFCGFGI